MTEPEHESTDPAPDGPQLVKQTTYLSADDILKADDRQVVPVEVPEWGGTVLVRALSGTERDEFEASLTMRRRIMEGPNKGAFETVPNNANANAKLVAKALVGLDGLRLFNDGQVIDLGQKSAGALTRVFEKAAELSGMTDSAVRDAEGNSQPDPSDAGT